MTKVEITKHNECFFCKHRLMIPHNRHIRCNNPDIAMAGDRKAIIHGWFNYPLDYDPLWKTKECNNFEEE